MAIKELDSIKYVLMSRDGMSANEADSTISAAYEELQLRLETGINPDSICADWFGLEDDYIFDLIRHK